MAVAQSILEVLQILAVVIVNYIRALVNLVSPQARKNVQGQIAVITGAGHGIGREMALELSRAGVVVVLWDINKQGNEETAELVRSAGGHAKTYTVDVRNINEIADAARKIRREVGEVTILVNNAGVINCAGLLDLSEAAIRRTFEVNTFAQFWTVREFLPSMLERKVGHIVNVASMASFSGTQLMTDYSASKFASRGFSDALRKELDMQQQSYVKVTTVCPMYVETGFLRTADVRPSDILTPHQVAVAAVDGLLREKETVFVPASIEYLLRISGLAPISTQNFFTKKAGFTVRPQYKKED